jgi:predicted PurR-regulated permease PerM
MATFPSFGHIMTNDRGIRGEAERSALPKIPSIEFVLAIAGLAMLFTLLYATQTLYSPFVLLIALFLVMYPLRTYPAARNVMIFALAVFILWFMKTIEMVLAPFAIALLLAYLLDPVVTRLERHRIPRWASTLGIILLGIAIIILILMIVVPMMIQQFGSILQMLSGISSQVSNWFTNGSLFRTLRRYGISNGQLHDFLGDTFAPRMQDVLKSVLQGASGIVSQFEAVLTGIVNIVILPFLLFFTLKDFPLVKHSFTMLVPEAHRDEVIFYYHHIDEVVGRYFRGTLIIAVFDAVMVSTLFELIGIPNALVIGVISGCLFFLPYVGLMTMLAITTVASTLSPDNILVHLILGFCVIGSLHIIETYMLSPKIIGDKIGLHPVLLIFSLFVFGYFMGFLGLLIAIPAAGSIKVIIVEWRKRHMEGAKGAAERPEAAGSPPAEGEAR